MSNPSDPAVGYGGAEVAATTASGNVSSSGDSTESLKGGPDSTTHKVDSTQSAVDSTQQSAREESLQDDADDAGSRKRKRVVLFGYSGHGFSGLQTQQGAVMNRSMTTTMTQDESGMKDDPAAPPDTVEDALHRALCLAGSISESNQDSFQKISWSRSARTDRGVHAASQVVAAKLEVPGEELPERGGDVSRRDEEAFVAKINSFLPNQIRVYRIFRVNNSFNARHATVGRTYGYFLPQFALKRLDGSMASLFDLRQALQCFVGSNLFHNFTERMSPKDPRTRRVIESFTASEPFDVDGHNVIRLQVKGQSFLKHHIRRMIGFAVECLRRGADSNEEVKSLIETSLSEDKLCKGGDQNMPMAPAESLFLDIAFFDIYNSSVGTPSKSSSSKPQQPGREPIDFVTDVSVRRAREKLIQEIILPSVFSKEAGGAFQAWENWLEQRDAIEFPPGFVTPSYPPELQDAQEFLRCVERDRNKRAKFEDYSRSTT